MRLSNLVNIGPRLEEILIDSGVTSVEVFREMGAVEAAYCVFEKYPDTALRLSALEGALRGTRWHNISKEDKDALEDAFREKCDKANV